MACETQRPIPTTACTHRIGRYDGVLLDPVGGSSCADGLHPPSGNAWEISETHCAVAHCGHRGRRERSDDSAGLPHRGFGGKSDMEQTVGCGIVYALTPSVTQFARRRGSDTTLHDPPRGT